MRLALGTATKGHVTVVKQHGAWLSSEGLLPSFSPHTFGGGGGGACSMTMPE